MNKNMSQLSFRKIFRLTAAATLVALAFGAAGSYAQDSGAQEQQPSELGKTAFDTIPELPYASGSPASASLTVPAGSQYFAFRPAPLSSSVAVVEQGATGQSIAFWTPGSAPRVLWTLPADTVLTDLEWLPDQSALVFLGKVGGKWAVLKQDFNAQAWAPVVLAQSNVPLRGVVVSNRKVRSFQEEKLPPYYRVFFGAQTAHGQYETRSVRDSGKSLYTLISATSDAPASPGNSNGTQPAHVQAKSALPVGYMAAGDTLVWADDKNCLKEINHDSSDWQTTVSGLAGLGTGVCGGGVQLLPNGTGVIQWKSGQPGAVVRFRHSAPSLTVAANTRFLAQPLLTADGKALFGFTAEAGNAGNVALVYEPVKIPLADVTNAWMFLSDQSSPAVAQHFTRDGGLLTPTTYQQIFGLYDSERYDREDDLPRPYMVTTDEYWELFAVAHEGVFIVTEQQAAIPAFWKMVDDATHEADQTGNRSTFANAFRVLSHLKAGNKADPEVARILAANGSSVSSVTHEDLDFSELKPRGHYAGTKDMQLYFRAMRYLTHVPVAPADVTYLAGLSESVQASARTWITSYLPYVAPPRATSVWKDLNVPLASYGKHLDLNDQQNTVFPLSWGFDNEVLNRTVVHEAWPQVEQVKQTLSSGLALASVLGSPLATTLLAPDIKQVANLGLALDALKAQYAQQRHEPQMEKNLYNAWLEALGTQWSASPRLPGESKDSPVWRAKMLQTGLASWATLRHTTLLVNDTSGAEGGEGGDGFESILQKPPRGYVEPSPEVWQAIAHLYDLTLAVYDQSSQHWQGKDAAALKKGYREKLVLARDHARSFARMASAERAGKPLSSADYVEILNTGAVVDHLFSEFKSVVPRAHNDYGLANPEPMSKIADVQNSQGNRLYAAVGLPQEWDQVVPYYGRHELVKGAVYSFNEFVDGKVLSDEDWRKQELTTPRPAWISPYEVKDVVTQKAPVKP
jgi:hypothetical protein